MSPEFDLSELPNLTFSAREGTSAKLKLPMKGTPLPTVKWQKNEEDLKEDTRVCVENTDISTMLMIKQVQKEDAGRSRDSLF